MNQIQEQLIREELNKPGGSLSKAARALGISRRMVAYYESGERPIPRVVALAAKALEAA